jgi:hypothetical protein
MRIPRLPGAPSRSCSSLLLAIGQAHDWALGGTRVVRELALGSLPALFLLVSTREEIYNILWALVFGFATINILSLGARRFEQKSGLNFGEVLAILVVIVSIFLLGWEMLYVFGILPIRLTPR